MAITVAGFSASTKTPGTYLALVFGGADLSAGDAPQSYLLCGNMIGTAITGASPTLSVTAGTASLNTVYAVFSPDEAKTYFGAGSELHLMAKALFAQHPAATVYMMASAQGATASTGVITITGTPTAAITCRVFVCGRYCDVAIAASDTVTVIATAIATAINQQTDWPVTAQFSAGVVTITAKHTGLRGTNIGFRAQYINATQTMEATAGALAITMTGSTLTLSGGTAVVDASSAGNYVLAGGTTEESLTTPLGVVSGTRYNRYVFAQQGATPLAAIAAQVDSMAAVGSQLLQQWVVGCTGTYAAVIALTAALNKVRGQIAWSYNNDLLPGELAAQLAAARMNGDAELGGSLVGEASDTAANLDGVRLTSVPAQHALSNQPTPSVVEQALNHGVTVLRPVGLTGLMAVPRSVTTRYLDDQGNPNYSAMDTSVVTIIDGEADALRAYLASAFAGKKLAADAADGSGPKIANVVTPSLVRAAIFGRLKRSEAAGRITNVDANAVLLVVQLDTNTSGRLLANIPIAPIPGLHQIAGNVRQAA